MTPAPTTCEACPDRPVDLIRDWPLLFSLHHALLAERTRELAEALEILSWVVSVEGSEHICPDNPEVCYVAAARRALSNGGKP